MQAIAVPVAEEFVYWLEGARTLVPGDAILGDPKGGVRMCPASWLGSGGTSKRLRAELAPVLDLPVERVLVSHGEPVLSGGLEALRSALAVDGRLDRGEDSQRIENRAQALTFVGESIFDARGTRIDDVTCEQTGLLELQQT